MANKIEQPTALSWEASASLREKRLTEARAQPGSNRDLLEKTRILRDVIDPAVLADEPTVAGTRWTQYGYVHAFDATEEFTRYYVKSYNSYHVRYRGDGHPCPVNPEFIQNEPGMMNALYSARQFADALGISYPVFISGMFAQLHGPGLYRRAPLPNHLYPPRKPRKRKWRKKYMTRSGVPVDHKALRHALKVQESMLIRTIIGYDWDRRFWACNYVGDPAQERALKALLEHRQVHTSEKGRLRRALEEGLISVDNAHRIFPDAAVESALREARSIPDIGAPDPGLTPYRPHCLGLYQSEAPAKECAECPWQSKCQGLASRAEAQQLALTGYANRRQREAIEARDRKRSSRARKKAKLAASAMPAAGPEAVSRPLI